MCHLWLGIWEVDIPLKMCKMLILYFIVEGSAEWFLERA